MGGQTLASQVRTRVLPSSARSAAPRVCRSCNASNSLQRNDLGFWNCFECGAQAEEAEELAEFDVSQSVGARRSVRVSRVGASAAANSSTRMVNNLLSDSKIILFAFDYLLHRQCKYLINHHRASPSLLGLVGRIWLSYLHHWRASGWGADQFSSVIHFVGRGFKRRHRKFVRSRENPEVENSEDSESKLSSDSASGSVGSQLSGSAVGLSAVDRAFIDSQVGYSATLALRRSVGHHFVLLPGELNLTLSLAIIALGLIISREPINVFQLIYLCDSGEFPWFSFLSSATLPPRFHSALMKSTAAQTFFNPKHVPKPANIIGLANFVGQTIQIPFCVRAAESSRKPPKTSGEGTLKTGGFTAMERNPTNLSRLIPVAFDPPALIRSILTDIQLPTDLLFPHCIKLWQRYSNGGELDRQQRIQRSNRFEAVEINYLDVVAVVILALKLIFQFDSDADKRLDQIAEEEENCEPIPIPTELEHAFSEYSTFLLSLSTILQHQQRHEHENQRNGFYSSLPAVPSQNSSIRQFSAALEGKFLDFVGDRVFHQFSAIKEFREYQVNFNQLADERTTEETGRDDYRFAPSRFWCLLSNSFSSLSYRQSNFTRFVQYSQTDEGFYHHSYYYLLVLISKVIDSNPAALDASVHKVDYQLSRMKNPLFITKLSSARAQMQANLLKRRRRAITREKRKIKKFNNKRGKKSEKDFDSAASASDSDSSSSAESEESEV